MNKKTLATLGLGIALGVGGVALTAAACTPDPTATPLPAPSVTSTGFDKGTLECGTAAKPAIDQQPDGSWWAYCEPALIGPAPDVILPACASEDQEAPACWWDATKQGNGKGTSFVVIEGTHYIQGGN